MTVIKLLRPVAFVDLAREIKRFGAMLETEAENVFGKDLVKQAVRQRVCSRRKTLLGTVLSLLHQGRKLTGMAGAFTPTDDALMNAVCLRDIGLRLEKASIEIDLGIRKRSLVFATPKKRVLVLAQHDGYALAALRRLHKKYVESGEFQQIQMFTYQQPDETLALTQSLYTPPRGSKPIEPTELPVFSLDHPKRQERDVTLPAGVLD